MGKQIDIQHDHAIQTAGETVPTGYVGLLAKADGMYEKLPGESGAERKLFNEGGGGGIVIPKLKLQHGHFRAAGDPVKRRDNLYATWDADDDSFMDHNPEIWVFRRRNIARRKLVDEILDTELCLDPGCDDPGAWTLNAGISVEDSVIKFNNVEQGESAYMPLLSSLAWPYAWYEITFTVLNYLSGGIKAFYGDGFTDEITSNGTYTIRIRRKTAPIAFGFIAASVTDTSLNIDNVSFRWVSRYFDISYKKKWAHEPHENGVKYPGSNMWAGQTISEIASIQASGRQTEFELTAGRQEKQLVGIDPYEYYYGFDIATSQYVKLSDSTVASEMSGFKAAGTTNLSIGFRLAIVIDHPSIEGMKLIGDLSDPVYLRLHKIYDAWGVVLNAFNLRYKSNQIIFR
jgi:hypothetical protein